MKANQIGIVDKIRVINAYPTILVRFTLKTADSTINCLVSKKSLANQLLIFENGQTEIACYGHANNRNQLVIEKMMVRESSPFLVNSITTI